jgi:hypothetical protein
MLALFILWLWATFPAPMLAITAGVVTYTLARRMM